MPSGMNDLLACIIVIFHTVYSFLEKHRGVFQLFKPWGQCDLFLKYAEGKISHIWHNQMLLDLLYSQWVYHNYPNLSSFHLICWDYNAQHSLQVLRSKQLKLLLDGKPIIGMFGIQSNNIFCLGKYTQDIEYFWHSMGTGIANVAGQTSKLMSFLLLKSVGIYCQATAHQTFVLVEQKQFSSLWVEDNFFPLSNHSWLYEFNWLYVNIYFATFDTFKTNHSQILLQAIGCFVFVYCYLEIRLFYTK